MYSVRKLDELDIKDIMEYEGQLFSDNNSSTGSCMCLKIDVDGDKVYYQESYSRYGNFTGKNIYGERRDDKLSHPRTGLKTMSMTRFYGAAIGWV